MFQYGVLRHQHLTLGTSACNQASTAAQSSAGAHEPVALQVTNHMNREAIHQMTGLPDRAVVFVRFEGEARNKQCLPYFIAADERSKAVGELQHAACFKQEYPTRNGQIGVKFRWG